MAGEPAAINGMDSTCLSNLLLVLYFTNEDVCKGKPSLWLSDIWGFDISQFLVHEALERDHEFDKIFIIIKHISLLAKNYLQKTKMISF